MASIDLDRFVDLAEGLNSSLGKTNAQAIRRAFVLQVFETRWIPVT